MYDICQLASEPKTLQAFNKYNWQYLYDKVKLHADDFTSDCRDDFTIHSGLIFTEERIARRPLRSWLLQLSRDFDQLVHLNNYKIDATNIESLAIIINQTGLIYAMVGEITAARELCERAIDYYYALYKSTNNTLFLFQVMQPWINLGRLDRIIGKHSASIGKFQLLIEPELAVTRVEKIIARAVTLAKTGNKAIQSLIDNCKVMEPIKSYLAEKNLSAIDALLTEGFGIQKECYSIFPINEIWPLLNYHRKNFDEFIKLTLTNHTNSLLKRLHIYTFRAAELAFITNNTNLHQNLIKKLAAVCNAMCIFNEVSLDDLTFMSIFCKHLVRTKQTDIAYLLLQNVLTQFIKFNDELGQITTLRLICSLEQEVDSSYEESLSALLQATDYCQFKKVKSPTNELKAVFNTHNARLFSLLVSD